jgi:hypothetical protein
MRRPAVALALAALAITGCGGSGGLSDKEYRAKADALCASVRSQRDRLSPSSNLSELRAAAQSTIAINTDALRRFQALKPPDDLKAPHAVIISRLAETLRLQQQAVKQTDPRSAVLQSINVSATRAHAALVAAAQQAKLPACEQI